MSKQDNHWKDGTKRGDLAMWLHRGEQGTWTEPLFGMAERCCSRTAPAALQLCLSSMSYLHALMGQTIVVLCRLHKELAAVLKMKEPLVVPELQLGYYPPNGSAYVRHQDAFPDRAPGGRKVSKILSCSVLEVTKMLLHT